MSNKATAHRVPTGADGVFLARDISVVVHRSWLTLGGGWGPRLPHEVRVAWVVSFRAASAAAVYAAAEADWSFEW